MACANLAPTNQDACGKAMEAAAKSSQLYQYSQKTEDYLMNYGKNLSFSVFGEDMSNGAGSTVYAYRVYRDKAASFKLPNLGICDSLNTRLTTDSYTLNFKWNLPW
jgi:hypothetical protein